MGINSRALKRALTRFREPIEVPPTKPPTDPERQCLARPPQPNPRQQCFAFAPPINNHPSIHARCSLKQHHLGYHYDAEYGIQWDDKTIAYNPTFLKHRKEKPCATPTPIKQDGSVATAKCTPTSLTTLPAKDAEKNDAPTSTTNAKSTATK